MLSQARLPKLTILAPLPEERVLERFTVAIGTAAIAILLRGVLDPVLGHVAFYATVYMAVAYSALVCGVTPAVVSSIVGLFGVLYWFVDPRHSLALIRVSEVHGVIAFILVSIVLIGLGHANRSKQLRLNATVAALREEAQERERVEHELRFAQDLLERRVADRTRDLARTLASLQSEVQERISAEKQLRHLSLRLMTLQDEERRRIARDLHDNTGQTLAAIKMAVAELQHCAANLPRVALIADDLNALADEALKDVRTTSYLLHPPLLDEAGIASAARWFVDGFSKRSGISITCNISSDPIRPSRDCELVLFRVLQESLTNVHRHSGASNVVVNLAFDNDCFTLEVADNGHGISPEKLARLQTEGSTGVGIAGMRERVRELGGVIDFHSDGTGTTVRVELPATRGASDEGKGQPVLSTASGISNQKLS